MATSSGVQVAPFWESLWRTSWDQQRQWLKTAHVSIIYIINQNVILLARRVSTEAGGQNNHQPRLKWKELIFFITLLTGGPWSSTWVAETQEGQPRPCQAQPVLMGSGAAVGTHLPGAHTLYHRAVVSLCFLSFLSLDLSQDSDPRLVHGNASKSLCTPMLSQHRYSISPIREA